MPAQNLLERTVEKIVGLDIETIRATPICELRKRAEEKYGKPKFQDYSTSYLRFPEIPEIDNEVRLIGPRKDRY